MMKYPIKLALLVSLMMVLMNRPMTCPATESAPSGKDPGTEIHALGRLEPDLGVIDLSAAAGEQRIRSVLVREGETVTKDQPLVELVGYEAQKAAVTWLEQQVKTARNRTEQERSLRQVLMEEAKVRQAQTRTRDEEALKTLAYSVTSLTAELAFRKREVERTQALNTKEMVSVQNYDEAKLELAKAQEALNTAKADLEGQKVMTRLDQTAARAEQATILAQSLTREMDIGLENLEQELAFARKKLATYVIPSPVDGEILTILSRGGEVQGERPILKLADTATMVAVAQVYETDLSKVRQGQKAVITSPAIQTKLTGKVTYISRLIFKRTIKDIDPYQPEDYRVAEVRILLDDPRTAARYIHLQVDVALEVAP